MAWMAADSRSSGDMRAADPGSPSMTYSSLAQAPKSMSLHRSEQKGRQGFVVEYSIDFPQVGHLTFMMATKKLAKRTEFELEGDISVSNGMKLMFFIGFGKPNPDHIFVGAYFGYIGCFQGKVNSCKSQPTVLMATS